MYIDSHMHLINTKCFDRPTYDRLGQSIPKDTDINQLVDWMKAAGIEHCVCMGQDMHKVWNSEFGEIAVEEAFANQGPTLKRIRPRSQGRADRILKRSSHITIILNQR